MNASHKANQKTKRVRRLKRQLNEATGARNAETSLAKIQQRAPATAKLDAIIAGLNRMIEDRTPSK